MKLEFRKTKYSVVKRHHPNRGRNPHQQKRKPIRVKNHG